VISARDAVDIAKRYVFDIYGKEIQGVQVEEIELGDDGALWRVTIGYWEFLPTPPGQGPLGAFSALEVPKVRRAYKTLTIGANNGEVFSMKIRPAPAPERK
jgi:hypothetical protein